jgi:HAD superfamily hydrolase (TIGR01509 family)
MLQAVIFDFDGVIVDSEPIHFAAFREVLAEQDVRLVEREYYARYVGFDDHDCFAAASADFGVPFSDLMIAKLVARKNRLVREMYRTRLKPLPGAVELLRAAAAQVPVAICSGALRNEIELAAEAVGASQYVRLIVAAEDVADGKPHPEGYLKAMSALFAGVQAEGAAGRCVVIEDTPAGIAAGKAAGAFVLGVTNSFARDQLAQADRVVDSLATVTVDDLRAMVAVQT